MLFSSEGSWSSGAFAVDDKFGGSRGPIDLSDPITAGSFFSSFCAGLSPGGRAGPMNSDIMQWQACVLFNAHQ